MTTDEYLEIIHLALVENPVATSYKVIRQRITSQSGYLRVRIDLVNGDFVEAAEFFRLTPDGIEVTDYRHQWMDGERTILRKRWDHTSHHLKLDKAPHHCHDGDEETVIPSEPMSIQDVLAVISRATQTTD